MKKSLLFTVVAAILSIHVMAGGIVTNSNQSAAYVRLLARNGAFGIDGVYYNPAGLTKLDKGFNFSFNNQTIFQTNGVVSNYPFLHHAPYAKYNGEVTAPIFPGIYAAYRFGKFAVSFGFNPVGGGGGAEYEKGLPSFEMDISDLVPSLSSSGLPVTDYSTDIYFKGTSVYFAYQLGLSYEIIPEVSVFAGARYVTVKNTYKGHIKDIMIDYGGQFIRADAFFTGAATQYTEAAALANAAANNINMAIQGGLLNPNDPLTDPTLIQGLEQLGIDPTGFTNAQAAGAYALAAQGATESAAAMTANAEATGDKEVDVTQKGTGVTPVIGVNLTLCEKLNIGLRYEFLTKIELKNNTLVDGTGEFPDGKKTRSDMPALLAVGATYPFTPKLRGYADFNQEELFRSVGRSGI
jgi:long-chain fatty acid transport protein